MELPIDYLKFASFEGLPINGIIYLLMGVDPNSPSNNKPPQIPKDYFDEIDAVDWNNFYFRIRDPIYNAIEVGSLTPVKADKFNPTEVGTYIYNISVEKGWDNDFINNPFIKALGITQNESIKQLEDQIKALEEKILRIDKRSKYTNNRLYWLDQVIEEYFVFDEVQPDKEEIKEWLRLSSFREEGAELSLRVRNAIATLVLSDKKRKGGAPKKISL